MKKSTVILIGALLLSALFTGAVQDRIGSRVWSTWATSATSLAGADPDTTDWIRIGDFQYFSLGIYIYTGELSFTAAIADSFGFDIDFEIDLGNGRGYQDDGFYDFTSAAPEEIFSFSITDTTKKYGSSTNELRLATSLHSITNNIWPGARIRFITNKDAIHEKTTSSDLYYQLFFFRQP